MEYNIQHNKTNGSLYTGWEEGVTFDRAVFVYDETWPDLDNANVGMPDFDIKIDIQFAEASRLAASVFVFLPALDTTIE